MITPPRRLRVFDAMRGFAMLLVVMGHVMMNCGLEASETTLFAVICTFNMPLFFLISGFFAYKNMNRWSTKTLKTHSRLKICALVICTFVFYALLFHTRHESIFGWTERGFGAYWFTICLFEMFLTYYFSIIVSKLLRHDIILPLMALISLVALALMIKNPFVEHRWWQIAGGANYCLFLQYFTIGLFAKRHKDTCIRCLTKDLTLTVLIISYAVLLCALYSPWPEGSLLRKIYSVFALPYSGTLLLLSLFLIATKFFDEKNAVANGLCLVGRRSLDIYMLHYFFLPPLTGLQQWLAPNSMILFQLLVSLAVAAAVICISIIMSSALRSSAFLSEYLFGVSRSKTTTVIKNV